MRQLDSNNHSVFKMNYHLVMVTKYRKRVITANISNRLKELFVSVANSYNISLSDWNFEAEHVRVLFSAHPNSSLSKFINAYKSSSSRLIKKEFPEIRKQLWREMFWSRSFCLLTVGRAPLEVLKQYIATQGEK